MSTDVQTPQGADSGWCPDCKAPTNSVAHFECISSQVFKEDDTMTSAVGPSPSPNVPAPDSTPPASRTDAVKAGFVERVLTALADASAKRISARGAADVAKIEAKAKLTQAAKAAKAGTPETGAQPAADQSGPQMKGLPWPVIAVLIPLGAIFWAIFFTGATFGQGLMLSHPQTTAMLAEHVEWTLDLTTGMIIGGVIEFAAVFFLFLSIARRIANDGGTGSMIASYAFAIISISINVFGHAWIGDTFGMVIFGFFSVTAFLGMAQVSDFAVRQIQRKRGLLDHTPPSLGLHFTRKHADLVLRYRAAYIANPALGKQGALEQARKEKKKEEDEAYLNERIAAIVKALKQMSNVRFRDDPVLADLWYLRHNPRLMAERLIAMTDNEAAVAELVGLMDEVESRIAAENQARIEEAVAERRTELLAERVERIAPTSGPNGTPTGDPNRPDYRGPKGLRKVAEWARLAKPTETTAAKPNGSDPASPNTNPTTTDNVPVATPKQRGRMATDNDATLTLPVVQDDKEAKREEARVWLLGELNLGRKIGRGGITLRQIEERLGYDPERSKGKMGGIFAEEVMDEFKKLSEEAQKGVKL